jgi:hypothetical protein
MQSLTFTQVDYQTLNTQAGIITGERADLNITMEEIATQQNVA